MEERLQHAFRFAIDAKMEEIMQHFCFSKVIYDFIKMLYDRDCLKESEVLEIHASGIQINMVKKLFEILKSKKSDAHQRCLDVIEMELGYTKLANGIKEEWKKACHFYEEEPFLPLGLDAIEGT